MDERVIWLVRHGYRGDLADPQWVRTAARPWDCGLAPEGVVQARETGQRLAQETIDHVFASPLLRAAETAHHIAGALGCPIRIEDGLSEALYETWFPVRPEFLTAAELALRFPPVDTTYRPACRPVYPEDRDAMLRRTDCVMRVLLDAFAGNLVLVGHGGSFAGLARALTGSSSGLHPDFCCLIAFVQRDGRWVLHKDGSDRSHLSCPDPGSDPRVGTGAAPS